MFGSLKLGRFFGVDLFIHGTFWLLPAFVLLSGLSGSGWESAIVDTAFLLTVFGCVVLHEYGHVFAARLYGIRTRDITLYPIGGAASLERMPEKPLPEIVIALAGPAVNVAIAFVLGVLLLLTGVLAAPTVGILPSAHEFLVRVLAANIGLVLFNLIPAFPMDGGRVLRAVLSLVTDRATATDAAATVGKVIAVGLFAIALVSFQPFLMFLAVSVYMLGSQEAAYVRQRETWKRQERAWRNFGYDDSPRSAGRDGWEFDPVNRMWTEYRGGMAVRRFRDA
jgi:Zn-dependent protease